MTAPDLISLIDPQDGRPGALLGLRPEPASGLGHAASIADASEEDDDYWDYDPEAPGIGCVNCDGGWRHGCCDDLCIGSSEPEWCDFARPCRHCNPHGQIL